MILAKRACAALLLATMTGAAAEAQLPNLSGGSGLGSLGGLIPNMSSASAGNAAGLLGYCAKNKLLGGQDASSVLGKLAGQSGVTASKDYQQGSAGVLQTGQGNTLSLASLKGQVKTRLCDMVLQHGRSLVGLQ